MERESLAWSDLVPNDDNYAFIAEDTFEIKSIDQLFTDANNIKSISSDLTAIIEHLRNITTSLKTNWENEQGEDIKSSIQKINTIITALEENIIPLYGQVSTVLNDIGTKTKALQAKNFNEFNSSGGPTSTIY